MRESSFHKDAEGLMRCNACLDYVCWLQTKEGKWYLGAAIRGVRNVSSRFEEKFEYFAVPSKIKIAHSRVCRPIEKDNNQDLQTSKVGA